MNLVKLGIGILISIFQGFAICIPIFKQIKIKPIENKILMYISMFSYCLISFYFIPNQLRFITSVIVINLFLYITLSVKSNLTILYSFNTVVIMTLSEIIVTSSLLLMGINSIDIVSDIKYNLIANILIAIITLIIINVPVFRRILEKEILLFQKKNLVNYLYLFLLLLYLIASKNGFELILKANYYINIIFVFFVIVVYILIINKERKYEKLKTENLHMYNYVTKYEKIITEQGKANHEFKNQLMVIRGYAQMNSKKLIEYIDSIVEDSRKTQSSYLIKQLNNFPDGGIKGLLYYKLSLIEEENIKYDLNVESGIKSKLNKLNTNVYKNITKILGVILDNAIEASKESNEKNISIFVTREKNNVIFIIQNTYKDNIEISKFGSGYTSKGIGRGYGLRLVNDIIKESSCFKVENVLENGYFISKLTININ